MKTNIIICVGGMEFPVQSIIGKIADSAWDRRDSKYITLEMAVEDVVETFRDGIGWSIVEYVEHERPVLDENGGLTYDKDGGVVLEHIETLRNEYDNSEYCVLGDIVIHPDGTCTVAMGKETTEEVLIMLMYGGVE